MASGGYSAGYWILVRYPDDSEAVVQVHTIPERGERLDPDIRGDWVVKYVTVHERVIDGKQVRFKVGLEPASED